MSKAPAAGIYHKHHPPPQPLLLSSLRNVASPRAASKRCSNEGPAKPPYSSGRCRSSNRFSAAPCTTKSSPYPAMKSSASPRTPRFCASTSGAPPRLSEGVHDKGHVTGRPPHRSDCWRLNTKTLLFAALLISAAAVAPAPAAVIKRLHASLLSWSFHSGRVVLAWNRATTPYHVAKLQPRPNHLH